MNENTEILKKSLTRIKAEVAKVIIGYDDIVDKTLIAIFSGTHALIEGVPGVAKTLLVTKDATHRLESNPLGRRRLIDHNLLHIEIFR